jgi:hypothetical protein
MGQLVISDGRAYVKPRTVDTYANSPSGTICHVEGYDPDAKLCFKGYSNGIPPIKAGMFLRASRGYLSEILSLCVVSDIALPTIGINEGHGGLKPGRGITLLPEAGGGRYLSLSRGEPEMKIAALIINPSAGSDNLFFPFTCSRDLIINYDSRILAYKRVPSDALESTKFTTVRSVPIFPIDAMTTDGSAYIPAGTVITLLLRQPNVVRMSALVNARPNDQLVVNSVTGAQLADQSMVISHRSVLNGSPLHTFENSVSSVNFYCTNTAAMTVDINGIEFKGPALLKLTKYLR